MGKSLISIVAEVGKSVADIPTEAITFLARQYTAMDEFLEGKTLAERTEIYQKLSYASFQKEMSKEETGIVPFDNPAIEDTAVLPLDAWLIMDGCFPEVFYAGAPQRAEEQALHQIVSHYEKMNLKRESGREWVVINSAETREILRKVRPFYENEKLTTKLASMNPEQKEEWEKENVEKHMRVCGVGKNVFRKEEPVSPQALDWYKELNSYFIIDANK